MTSAQGRVIRQMAEREARLRQSKDEVLDALLAILAHHGGSVSIPLGTVETATRQEVVLEFTKDDLIVSTLASAKKRGEPKGGVRRMLGSMFGGN